MKNIDRMGALVLMSHLVITLAMIGAYTFFTYLGKSTTSIENMLLIAVGFWFASMGQNAIKQPQQTNHIQHVNEVKTAPAEKDERGN